MATIGDTYSFSYVGGRVYDPELCSTDGIYVGQDGKFSIFYVKLPVVINELTGYLIYTIPRDLKLAANTVEQDRVTTERIARYIKTFAYANQRPNLTGNRCDPTVYISQTKIDSFLASVPTSVAAS